jgi:hypothetical protein
MLWLPFRRAWRNPVFRGGVEEFARNPVRWSYGINYLILVSIVLFIAWPKEGFLHLRDLPFTYVPVGVSILGILAYINFSQGSRKLLGSEFINLRDWLGLAPLPAGTFLRGYLAIGFLECLFFWCLSLPLLVLAASVSGESGFHLGVGAVIILLCAASYRSIAVALFVCFERDEFLLYLLARVLCVFFIVVSGFVLPLCNPVLAFIDASIWHDPKRLASVSVLDLTLPGWIVTGGLHLLLGGLFFIIASMRVRWMQQRATRFFGTQEETAGGAGQS